MQQNAKAGICMLERLWCQVHQFVGMHVLVTFFSVTVATLTQYRRPLACLFLPPLFSRIPCPYMENNSLNCCYTIHLSDPCNKGCSYFISPWHDSELMLLTTIRELKTLSLDHSRPRNDTYGWEKDSNPTCSCPDQCRQNDVSEGSTPTGSSTHQLALQTSLE